jgi:thiamine biosynthesis lipoprotein
MRALGSAVRLTVDGSADGAAVRAWDAVRAEFDAVDRSLSRFRDDSELTRLNRLAGSATVVPVSRRLRTALALVDRAGRVTGGRFDASILGTLERIGERGARLDAVPGTPLAVSPRELTGRAHVPPVPLDMGGVGKGLALRWAAAAAMAELAPGTGLLLEAGGDLIAAGASPEGGWPIGIEDPAAEPGGVAAGDTDGAADAGADATGGAADEAGGAPPLVVLALSEGAVATSSVRVRNWIAPDGRPVHHLVDPATREPARTGLLAVTVAHSDPAWAEIWSKALFVAGRDAIADEARARGLAAWWVDDRGRLGMTPDARVRTLWAAEDRLG